MKATTIEKATAIFQQHSGPLRASQAIRLGVAPRTLYALRDAGRILQITRGVYRLLGDSSNGHSDLVQVALRVPKGIICLISALEFHSLTTQIPHQVYVALPLHAEKPRLSYPPVHLFWLSQAAYSAGIEQQLLDGVSVRIYSREKTIADCFKYRNKIGLEVALEALKEGLRQGCKPEILMEFARIDRVWKTLQSYLEALQGHPPDVLTGHSHSASVGASGEGMMDTDFQIQNEERLVAELEWYGVRYLSRRTDQKAVRLRAPRKLLADLVQQPSSRVRLALIALLLARPSFAEHVPAALETLPPAQAQTLKLFYTAAVVLQRQYAASLRPFLGADWRWLPDLFSAEFNLPSASGEHLRALARLHQQNTGMTLNWAGTYENVARRLLRRWELEQTWNQ
jgi:hypothetical protein